jgi:hypothetical protein
MYAFFHIRTVIIPQVPTEEEMDAWRMKNLRSDDPVANFKS